MSTLATDQTTTEVTGDLGPGEARPVRKASDRFAYGLVVASVAFGLWTLRAERNPVAYPNDSSVHSLSVAYARMQWASGHFPFDGWFPYLSLGSPFFMHYQSTPAVLTGLVALVFGSAHSFSWALYLLLSTWPISVYFGARLFSMNRWQAAVAAAIAPFVNSVTGYGFEHQAYDWLGNGLWPQLFGMWMLPLAWGYSWQAVSRNKHRFAAIATLAATIAFHFLTAYLAGVAVIVWIVLRPSQILKRIGRAAIISIGALAATLWITVPIVVYAKWGSINEFQLGTFWDDSYGARRILSWLVEGSIYDSGRSIAVLTYLVGVGIVVALIRWRGDETGRALLGVWIASMLLYFGRPTLGVVANHLPGQENLFFQRFNTGVDLAGIMLAAIGSCSFGELAIALVRRFGPRLLAWLDAGWRSLLAPAVASALVAVTLIPAWTQINDRGYSDASSIAFQQATDSTTGQQLNALLAIVNADNDGRVYAGLPSNWGANFRVGEVPVYIYLADEGVDAVGFTLRTSSLMSGPEVYFDDAVAGDFPLFGVHFIILPVADTPDVPAKLLAKDGSFGLWSVGPGGYFEVVDTQGTITADNADLGSASSALLGSKQLSRDVLPTVTYSGAPPATPTLATGSLASGSPGTVLSSSADLAEGKASAVVRINRRAVVLFSVSYDPGWRVTVDGVPAATEMVAPALVGVTVGPGEHTVAFHYAAFAYYPELFAIGAVALIGAALAFTRLGVRFARRRRRRASPA